jgi:hypothetical protein
MRDRLAEVSSCGSGRRDCTAMRADILLLAITVIIIISQIVSTITIKDLEDHRARASMLLLSQWQASLIGRSVMVLS